MSYTLEYVNGKINQSFYEMMDDIDTLNLQQDINGIHNQNRISLNFSKSKYYQNYNLYDKFFEYSKTLKEEEKRPYQIKIFRENLEEYSKLDKEIAKKTVDTLEFKDLEPYLKLLPKHLDVQFAGYTHSYQKDKVIHCRFGCNRLSRGLNQDDVKYVLENTKKIKHLLKTGFDFKTKLDINWHVFLTTCWTLIEGGVAEVALDIANTITQLFDIQLEKHKSAAQNVFVALYRSLDIRSKISTQWIKVMSLKQLGRIEETKDALKYIINSFLDSNCFYHYILFNRVVEASILLYILEPTKENETQSKYLLIENSKTSIEEPTETVRERGFIVYDFCKHILKQDI